MAKPVIFYAVTRNSWTSRSGFRVLEVTSEKGRQVYGRDEHGAATHVSARDVLHRFPTKEQANAGIEAAIGVRDSFRDDIRAARERFNQLERDQQDAMTAALKDAEARAGAENA